jgi:hypothetical protein
MYGGFLLGEGIEMEVQADLKEVLDSLEREVPTFVCDEYSYQLSPTSGKLGAEWRLLVKLFDPKAEKVLETPIGFIIVSRQPEGTTALRIPPRHEWSTEEAQQFDSEGKFFTSFILQLLNAFQRLGYISLPGQLPTS